MRSSPALSRDRFPYRWTTRFAPAPTGLLHLGHVVSALYVWGLARAFGGRVLLRIEDHDRSRCRADYEAALLEDLAWLGFAPDAPPTCQRDHGGRYADALARLEEAGLVYPCACSRREVALASPVAPGQEPRYGGRCRDRHIDPTATPARRLRLPDDEVRFDDLLLGPRRQHPAAQCGDVLLRDRLGQWTYQFSAVVDDMVQGVDVVIRGEDLLESTGRQVLLARLLGRNVPPLFAHHPLVRRPGGAKLSKSAGDSGVRELRAAGVSAALVLGRAAAAAGLLPAAEPIDAAEVAALFR